MMVEKAFQSLSESEKKLYRSRLIAFLANPPFSLEDHETEQNGFSRKEDMEKALDYLETFQEEPLSTQQIITVGNQVSESHPYISRGYRQFGTLLEETKTPIPPAEEIPLLMEKLVFDYQETWKDLEPFAREAHFFTDMIRIHPFEDGNRRTAFLFVNLHLLKQGYAPVYLTDNIYKEYLNNLHHYRLDEMTELFQRQSQQEAQQIKKLFQTSQNRK